MDKKRREQSLYLTAVLIFLILTLGPVIWTLIISITPEYEMFTREAAMFPHNPTLENWMNILENRTSDGISIKNGLKNSVTAVIRTLCIGLPIVTTTGYVLARGKFKGRKVIKNILLITMVIPRLTIIIPVFRIFASAHMLNDPFWLSVVYVGSFLPMTTWLMSNYFSVLPWELEEAAALDGCGKIGTFLKVILPISYPILFSAALIICLNTWNQFQIPLILTSSVDMKPISVVASEFTTKELIKYGITAACGLTALLPPAIVALVFRKFLVGGMIKGAAKG